MDGVDAVLNGPAIIDPVFDWVIRLALVLLFGTAAWHKGRDLRDFGATLRNYRLLPSPIVLPVALGLVLCELTLAALLLFAPGSVAGPLTALGLLALYSGALALNLARGRRDLDCGCFGPAFRQPISSGLLFRNAAVALLPLMLLQGAAPRSMNWIDLLSIAGATAMAALFWHAGHQLARSRPIRLTAEDSA